MYRKPSVNSFEALGQYRIARHNEESSPQVDSVVQLMHILGFYCWTKTSGHMIGCYTERVLLCIASAR